MPTLSAGRFVGEKAVGDNDLFGTEPHELAFRFEEARQLGIVRLQGDETARLEVTEEGIRRLGPLAE